MRKLLFLVLSSFLVLAACGSNDGDKKEDKKETKSTDKESKKENKKKDDDKKSDEEKDKSDNKSNKKLTTQDKKTAQVQTDIQEQQPVQSQERATVVEEQNGFTSGPTEEHPANLNPNEEQNTNMNGEHVVSPGWTQEEQSAAYEEYKKGKQAQAAAGPSAVPGAGLMDLDE